MNTIFYTLEGKGYLNITNRCMMACPYCMKNTWNNKFYENDLKLDKEPTVNEIINSIDDIKKYKEIVFCGYGDALTRIKEVIEVSKYLKEYGVIVRINTAGLANRYYGKNILPELEDIVDALSISLNGTNPQEHSEINKPMFEKEAFGEIVEFAKKAKEYIPDITITAVDMPLLDTSKIAQIAKEIDVKFRLRPYLGNNEQ